MVVLVAALAAVAGLWLWGNDRATREFDEAVALLERTRKAHADRLSPEFGPADLPRVREGRAEMARRFEYAFRDVAVTPLPPGLVGRHGERQPSAHGQWMMQSDHVSLAAWEEICAPIDFVVSAEFEPNAAAIFGKYGDFDGDLPYARLMLHCLMEREFRSGGLDPARIASNARFVRLVRLICAFDSIATVNGESTQLGHRVTRAVLNSSARLSPDEVQQVLRCLAPLAQDFPAQHGGWLDAWDSKVVDAGTGFRNGSVPAWRRSKLVDPFGPESWRGRLFRPWQLGDSAVAVRHIAAMKAGLDQGKCPQVAELAGIMRDVRLLEPRNARALASERFADGFVALARVAKCRAWMLLLGAALAGETHRDEVVRHAPDALRLDPCSGKPFEVTRTGDTLSVRSAGFAALDVTQFGFDERERLAWREWVKRRLGDGVTEVRAELPPALR